MKNPSVTDLVRKRPAELTAALAGSLGGLATAVLENSPAAGIVIAVVGLIPAIVSQLVDLGPTRDSGPISPALDVTDAQAGQAVSSSVLGRLAGIAALDALKRSRADSNAPGPLEILRVLTGAPEPAPLKPETCMSDDQSGDTKP